MDAKWNLTALPTKKAFPVLSQYVDRGLLRREILEIPPHCWDAKHLAVNNAANAKLRELGTGTVGDFKKLGNDLMAPMRGSKKSLAAVTMVPTVMSRSIIYAQEEPCEYSDEDEKIRKALDSYIRDLEIYERKLRKYENDMKRHEETIAYMKAHSSDYVKITSYWDNGFTRFLEELNPISGTIEISIDLGTSVHAPSMPEMPEMPEILKNILQEP